jgi:hypothetical protein
VIGSEGCIAVIAASKRLAEAIGDHRWVDKLPLSWIPARATYLGAVIGLDVGLLIGKVCSSRDNRP